VINAMLHDEFVKFQEQISRQIRKQNRQLLGHFKEIQFTQADWMQIKHLNNELEVRCFQGILALQRVGIAYL
ncbi:hypothetical protein VP01_3188g2, partial [Puccinia sorghi]